MRFPSPLEEYYSKCFFWREWTRLNRWFFFTQYGMQF